MTVVGARRASTYGREVARELGRELAAAGLVVVSGLAFGIDACAHRGALEGGLTVAVLGCGADVAYPAAHRSLWRRICERGLVLSELPPGTGAWRWTFPARNRIMAALAGMTVVVEAAERSGSLITADLAADLGRDLGAVPGPGRLALLGRAEQPARRRRLPGPRRPGRARRDARARSAADRAVRAARWSRRSCRRLEALELGAETCDAVAAELGLSGAEAAAALADLEALGYVTCSLVGVYSRTLLKPTLGRHTAPSRWSDMPTGLLSAGQRTCSSGDASIPAVLSIAGSDSGGGAGIQADLKAFARCGVHGMTAITAITAQNTVGVSAVEAVSPAMIVAQVRAVAEDIGVDAVKIGMLGTAETVDAVVEALALVGDAPVVVDPVMVAESGAVLLDDERADGAGRAAAAACHGGHPEHPRGAGADRGGGARLPGGPGPRGAGARPARRSSSPAATASRSSTSSSTASRRPRSTASATRTGASHGSGCTHSSALAAFLALRRDPAGGGAQGARGRLGRGRRRAARDRRRARPGRRLRPAGTRRRALDADARRRLQ